MPAAAAKTRLLFVALLVTSVGGVARAERLPMQSDVDKCAKRASDFGGDSSLQGRVRLQLLIRKTGQVYAAFVHSTKGIDNKVLLGCFANTALLWGLQPVAVDYSAPFPLTLVSGGADSGGQSSTFGVHSGASAPSVFMPSSRPEVEPADLDEKVAQATLEVKEDCTSAEQGLALAAVQKYPEAITHLRTALAANDRDLLALRGLSQALVESKGNLVEARALAEKLSSAAVDSVVGPEAMIRVCAAQKDDACVFEQWKKVKLQPDLGPRSRGISEMQPLVQSAASRLAVAAKDRAAVTPLPGSQGSAPGGAADPATGAAAAADPCATEQGDERQALCVVKRCLEEGSISYAKELSGQNGVEYVAGDWRTKLVGAGKMLVTRPIGPKSGEAARHDAIWLVKLGEQFSIAPSTSEAKQITLKYNACARK